VGIPVYSAVDHVHDYVVQARGAFDETILGILKLKNRAQRVEIRVVLHALTAPRIAETCKWLARNLPFVNHVALMGLEDTGFALANAEELWIDPADYRAQLAEGVEVLVCAGVKVSVYNDGKGRLIIAVSGDQPALPSSPTKMWTNPETGSKRFCGPEAETYIIAIDEDSLDVQQQRHIPDSWVTAIRLFDGRVYAVSNFIRDCRLAKNIRLSALDDTLAPHTIYESSNSNGLEARDFEVTPDRFVLVGMAQSFTPTAVTTKIMTLEQLRNYKPPDPRDDSLWEQNEERSAAFILVLGRDGVPRADRVFVDLRARSLTRVVADSDQRFLAVGAALGAHGWLIDFIVGGGK
jgi:hypothetical protein